MSADEPLTHDDLVGILFGSSAFQMLDAGCRLGLFPLLRGRPGLTAEEIADALSLATRPTQVLLLGTTALRLTVREGGRYRLAGVLAGLFDDGLWDVVEDLVAFEAHVVLPSHPDFVESLRQDTNAGLRRLEGSGDDLYHRLAADPDLEALFYRCMRSWSRLSNPILVAKTDLAGVRRVLDIGGGDGVNAIALARSNPDVRFTVLDLPGAAEIARTRIAEQGLADRISVREGDIFADRYPEGHDCILFANQLIIWSPEQISILLGKAYHSLPRGGRVIAFSAMSDDSRDGPLYAALDNVYFMTLAAPSSTVYCWSQYEDWLRAAGFVNIERFAGGGWTPHGVITATT